MTKQREVQSPEEGAFRSWTEVAKKFVPLHPRLHPKMDRWKVYERTWYNLWSSAANSNAANYTFIPNVPDEQLDANACRGNERAQDSKL